VWSLAIKRAPFPCCWKSVGLSCPCCALRRAVCGVVGCGLLCTLEHVGQALLSSLLVQTSCIQGVLRPSDQAARKKVHRQRNTNRKQLICNSGTIQCCGTRQITSCLVPPHLLHARLRSTLKSSIYTCVLTR